MNRLGKSIVTGLGTGYLPIAPGTWGSAAVCAIFLGTIYLGGGSIVTNGVMLALAAAASVACVALGGAAESAFGKTDPPQCTIDEWAGQAIALLGLPLGPEGGRRLACAGAGFLAFRLLDIVKPPPAMQLQRLPGGWGILVDDLIAGVYANIVAQLFLRLILPAL